MRFILCVLIFVSLAVCQQTCKHDSDCNRYSESPQYVMCSQDKKCVCLSDQGFSGNATLTNKCRCINFLGEPNVQNNIVIGRGEGHSLFGLSTYCGNLDTAIKAQREEANCKLNMKSVSTLASSLIWTDNVNNPLRYIYSALGLPSNVSIYDFLSPQYKLRVLPFGTFNDVVDAFLYYAVFAIDKIQVPSIDIPYLYCRGNYTYARLDLGFGFVGIGVFLNITEVATYTTDENHKLVSADAYAIRIPTITAPTIADQGAYIAALCTDLTINPGFWPNQTHGFCSQADDPLGYYSSYDDCVTFMNSIPFGDYTDAEQDTVICRGEHRTMSFWRPWIHCKHSGKTGQPHCVPHTYESFYQQKYKRDSSPPSYEVGPYFADLVRKNPPSTYSFSSK